MQAKKSSNIKVIDVSHWQGTIDWRKVKADGVQGAFIKASEGTTYVDPEFKTNTQNAIEAGIKVGFYHFAHPTNDPAKEVDHFLKTVNGFDNDFPLVLDLEGNKGLTKSQVTIFAEKWMQEMIRRTGKMPLFYTYTSFAKTYLDKSLGKYPIWIAQYTTANQPSANDIWNTWDIWQYSDSGKVNGITGNVDMNDMEQDFWNQHIKAGYKVNYEYNKIYKERIYASSGKLIRCDGDYKTKATDVRIIKFQTGKVKYRFVYEKGKKVSELVKKYGADYGFNGPYFNNDLPLGDSEDNDKVISAAYGKMLKWHEFAVVDGKPIIGQLNKNDKQDLLVQGAPLLVENGVLVYEKYRVSEEVQDDIGKSRCQRTFVGVDANGDLWLFVADGRSSSDQGLTLQEMALFVQSKGCINALNFDGGGSTILADQTGGMNQSLNRGANERVVHHAILVFLNKNFDEPTKGSESISGYTPIEIDLIDATTNKSETVLGVVKDGRSFIELRKAGEFFGLKVGYSSATKKASLIIRPRINQDNLSSN